MNIKFWFDSLSENTKVCGIGGSLTGFPVYILNITHDDSVMTFLLATGKAGVAAAFGGFMTLFGKWAFERLFKYFNKSNPKL